MAVLYRDPMAPGGPDAYPALSAADAPGLLDVAHPHWEDAARVCWGPPAYRTCFRARWSAAGLVVRFDCTDPSPWHTMTERDDRLWEEEVVEIFLDPAGGGCDYAEIEINPANVVCDLRIREPWPRLRGDISWNLEGLVTRVVKWPSRHQAGASAGPNDDPAGGWTALALLPWAGFESLSAHVARKIPPVPGDAWRFNVCRIKRPGGRAAPEREAVYAAWSVPDAPSFHVPAAFKELRFEHRFTD